MKMIYDAAGSYDGYLSTFIENQERCNFQTARGRFVSIYQTLSGKFDNHFSTIGLVGMNEAGLNARWLKCDMTDVRTQEFTKRV